MAASDDKLTAGWLTQLRRGVVSGVAVLLLAVVLCAIPTFLAWFAPGTDTVAASSAVKAAVLVTVSAQHGGLVLDGTAVTLTPLLITALLGWLVGTHAKRPESVVGFIGFVAGFVAATGVLAEWAQLGATRAPVARSMIAALLFAMIIGGFARGREAGWQRLPQRGREICRAVGVASAVYVLAGALLATGALVSDLSEAIALQRQVAPGAAGLPLALIGLAATPNAVMAAVGYLTGPGFAIGDHTAVSMFAASHGRLPVFPMLAGVPAGGPATALGLTLGALAGLAAGWAATRLTPSRDDWSQRILDVVLVALGTGIALGMLVTLGAGGIGGAGLRQVGANGWQVGLATIVIMVTGSAISIAIRWALSAVTTHEATILSVIKGADTAATDATATATATATASDAGGGAVDATDDGDAPRRTLRSTG
jgi:hypothetical protein